MLPLTPIGVPAWLQAGPGTSTVDEFYTTLSTLSLTLLGLWWVVVEVRLTRGDIDSRERRHFYSVLMFFLLPGLISLFSLVDDSSTWWRLVFGIIAVTGMAEIALYYQTMKVELTPADRALRAGGFCVYALIALVAVRPALSGDLGLGISGLQLEAILVSSLLVIGIHVVFLELGRPRAKVT